MTLLPSLLSCLQGDVGRVEPFVDFLLQPGEEIVQVVVLGLCRPFQFKERGNRIKLFFLAEIFEPVGDENIQGFGPALQNFLDRHIFMQGRCRHVLLLSCSRALYAKERESKLIQVKNITFFVIN